MVGFNWKGKDCTKGKTENKIRKIQCNKGLEALCQRKSYSSFHSLEIRMNLTHIEELNLLTSYLTSSDIQRIRFLLKETKTYSWNNLVPWIIYLKHVIRIYMHPSSM